MSNKRNINITRITLSHIAHFSNTHLVHFREILPYFTNIINLDCKLKDLPRRCAEGLINFNCLLDKMLFSSFPSGRIVVQNWGQPAFGIVDIPTLACSIILDLVFFDLADAKIVAVSMADIKAGH
jgi:hypothetical protein